MSELATPTERIMADADKMLAALKRDLELAAAQQPVQEIPAASEAPIESAEETSPPEPALHPEPVAVIGERRDEIPGDVQVWVEPAPDPEIEEREEPESRPRRGRVAGLVVLALAFVVAPAVVWTQRNPETVRAWGERLAAIANGSISAPAKEGENVGVPEGPAGTTSTQQEVPPVDGAKMDATPAASVASPTVSSESTDASTSRSADPPKAESTDAPPVAAPVDQARPRSTKARSGSRSTSRTSRSASRERVR
jgi:hypothetical protein